MEDGKVQENPSFVKIGIVAVALFLGCILLVRPIRIDISVGEGPIQQEAIERGFAYLHPKTGKLTWKESKDDEK